MQVFCWMVLLGTACLSAVGQPLTMTDISRARATLARSRGLTDAERSEISGLYDQAAQSLQQEIHWKALSVGHTRRKVVIGSELEAARAAAVLPPPGLPPAPPSETAQQVEEELTRVRNDRASVHARRDELSKLQTSLIQRGEEIIARRADIRENLRSMEDEMSVLSLASASPQWEQASRTALQAQRQSLEQELQALGAESEVLDLRQQLIPLQREAYLLRLEVDDQSLNELRLRKASARMRDAKKSLEDAVQQARALAGGFPQLAGIAADVTSRATALWGPDGIEARSDVTVVQTEEMGKAAARFKEITANTLRRYQNSGVLSPASEWWPPRVEKFGSPVEVGMLLVGYSANEVAARRDVLRLEEDNNGAPAFGTQVQRLLDASGKKPGDSDFEQFNSRARSLLQLKRSVNAEFLLDGRAYLNRLGEAHRVAAELLQEMRELQSFVLQHVLWSRSISGPVLPSAGESARAFLWFFSYRSWSQIIAGFNSAKTFVLLWLAGLPVIIALFLFRERWRKWLGASRFDVRNPGRILPLLSNIVRGLASALPAPLAIAYVGWLVGQLGKEVDLGRAIAGGADGAARFLYAVLLLRRMLADGGAADRLMGWRQEVRESLDGGLRRLAFVFTPLCFVSAALAEEGMNFNGDSLAQSYHNSLGRLCFMIAMLSLLYIGRRILKQNGPVAAAIGEGYDTHGVAKARVARGAFTLACCVPFVLAFLGFYVTAHLLLKNTFRTVAWTIVLMLLYFLLRRWRLNQAEEVSASSSPQDEELAHKAEEQVRRLSRFGLTLVWIIGAFFIWSAALPALSLLKRVELLPEFRVVVNTTAESDHPPAAETPPQAEDQKTPPGKAAVLPVPTTAKPAQTVRSRQPLLLSDVLLAIFVGILTSMLVSNIPGVLQFTVFRRMKLDVGGQYAVEMLARYFVIIVGMAMVSWILGVNWSSIQWLAAALTFGIGFGLQEIFANFASGLILLFDRSIRVGDAVTVGDLSGVVARIQMRATTVTLWDRSDMVVPNKEFITTKLVNWTLSHPETRVDLKVGVDYESDVEQVREVLMRLAHEHPAVLKDPAPQVLLTEFAPSAILFELRVHGLYAYGRPVLLDELQCAVVREFRKVGIAFAFPRLDVQLNAVSPKAHEPKT